MKGKNERPSFWLHIASLPLYLYALFTLLILLYIFMTSLKSRPDFIMNFFGLPKKISFTVLHEVVTDPSFLNSLKNSVIVTGCAVGLNLFLGAMASFALARYAFRLRGTLYTYFLLGLMIPPLITVLPVFKLLKELSLLNTYPGLILASAAPLSLTIMILTGFIKLLPQALLEAARMEGAGEFRIFSTIVIPLMKPAIATVVIINSITIWNDVINPMIFTTGPRLRTLMLELLRYMGQTSSDWMGVFAGAALSMIPVIAIYVIFSKKIIGGITVGAVK